MPKYLKSLYAQVILAIIIGIVIDFFYSLFAIKLKPIGDGFSRLVKMMIAPVIFCTIVNGIDGMQNEKKLAGWVLRH